MKLPILAGSKFSQEVYNQVSNLYYELAPGIHTYSDCDCGRGVTRCGTCWFCQMDLLVKYYERGLKKLKIKRKRK